MSPSAGGIRIRLLAFKVLELDFTKVLINLIPLQCPETVTHFHREVRRTAVSYSGATPATMLGI